MPKGYWIGHVTVNDDGQYPEYIRLGSKAYEKYGARFLVRGGRYENPEGTSRARNVVVEFADYETALACYNSEEYAAARAVRQRCADTDFLIIEGVD